MPREFVFAKLRGSVSLRSIGGGVRLASAKPLREIMKPLYACFFTPAYHEHSRGLVSSLREFNLDFQVSSMPDSGRWVTNCAMKPGFILSLMDYFPSRPIVWVDADARICKYPQLFDDFTKAWPNGPDFAAHWFKETTLCSGTLYFSGGSKSRDLVEKWIEMQDSHPEEIDQRCLQGAVDTTLGLKIQRLPPEYCFMQEEGATRDISSAHYGNLDPVILHLQHSRTVVKT